MEKGRGKIDDPDEVLNGFCLRIFGRLIDLAAHPRLGPALGRKSVRPCGPPGGKRFPAETRWFR